MHGGMISPVHAMVGLVSRLGSGNLGMKQKAGLESRLGMRLGSRCLGMRLGSGNLGMRLGSGNLGVRLVTSVECRV